MAPTKTPPSPAVIHTLLAARHQAAKGALPPAVTRLAGALSRSIILAGDEGIREVAREILHASGPSLLRHLDDLLHVVRSAHAVERDVGGMLIIEENPDLAHAFEQAASELGETVSVANSLTSARAILEQESVRLVVTEAQFHDGDVRDLLAEFCGDPVLAFIPVIVLAGSVDLAVHQELVALGATEVHQAPDPTVFTRAIRSYLGYEQRDALMWMGDPLTGLFDADMVRVGARRLRASAVDPDTPWTLMMLRPASKNEADTDTLVEVADAMRAACPDDAILGRWHEANFIALLPQTRRADAEDIAAAIKARFPEIRIGGTEVSDQPLEEAMTVARRMLAMSRRSGGTTVLIELPPERPTKRSILVVEDDFNVADLIQAALSEDSLKVHHRGTGASLIQVLQSVRPKLLILDLELPGQTGLDLLKIVREHPRFQKLPVIIITAHGSDRHQVAALGAGADDFLIKPFSPKVLRARVQALLRK